MFNFFVQEFDAIVIAIGHDIGKYYISLPFYWQVRAK